MILKSLTTVWSFLISMPATLAHELTHWLVSLPWTEQSGLGHTNESGFFHVAEWEPDAPAWAVVLTSIAPTILGSLVGVVGLYYVYISPPGTINQWALSAAIAAWWVIYAHPSPEDCDFSAKYTADEDAEPDTDTEAQPQEIQHNG